LVFPERSDASNDDDDDDDDKRCPSAKRSRSKKDHHLYLVEEEENSEREEREVSKIVFFPRKDEKDRLPARALGERGTRSTARRCGCSRIPRGLL
jgi:hypothetical protein